MSDNGLLFLHAVDTLWYRLHSLIFHSMNSSSEPQGRRTTHFPSPIVHAGVVTEWSLRCLHQSLHREPTKPLKRKHFQLHLHLSYIFKPVWIFGTDDKIVFVLGHPLRDRNSLGIKQTQDKPNANRGCTIKLVNYMYIQTQLSRLCAKSS